MQRILRFLRGYVKIRIKGYSPERFLNLCSHHQIDIWGLQPCKNSYEMYVKLKDFRKIRPIVRKTRTKVILVERFGMPFFNHKVSEQNMVSRRSCALYAPVDVLHFVYLGYPF